jgi:hypothetical protein
VPPLCALSVDEFLSWHNAMQGTGCRVAHHQAQNYRYLRPKKLRDNVARCNAVNSLEVLMSTVAVPEKRHCRQGQFRPIAHRQSEPGTLSSISTPALSR